MSKGLLFAEEIGGRIRKWWSHDGKVTAETIQSVDPVFRHVERCVDGAANKSLGQYKGSIPANVVDDMCKSLAGYWGTNETEVFRELMAAETDRAKKAWNHLTKNRDLSRFHAKTY